MVSFAACCALTMSGCWWHRPPYTLPPEADIARSAAYSTAHPPFPGLQHSPVSHEMPPAPVFYPSPQTGELQSAQPFEPMPNYFPDDGPFLNPAPDVELAPAPLGNGSDIHQMSGVYCCQRCQRLTEELESMSQRVDELTAMMEAQRLTVESLNAALIRADANIEQLHDDVAWHRAELDRMRTETEEQQRRDVERLQEIAEIVERLSRAP